MASTGQRFAVQRPAASGCVGHQQNLQLHPRKAQLPRPALRLQRRWRAAAEKEGTKEDSKLRVPDTPPPKSATPPPEPPASSNAGTSGTATAAEPEIVEERMTMEEIQRQMGQLRAAAQAETKKDGLVEGVLEEVKLIKWPTPKSALLNTLLVIAIVAGTSALLLGLNAVLAELSAAVYTRS